MSKIPSPSSPQRCIPEEQTPSGAKPAIWGFLEDPASDIDLVLQMPKTKYIIGRSTKTDRSHPREKYLSACHCAINLLNPTALSKENPKVAITDLKSRNGTFVNNKRLEAKEETLISDDDDISFAGPSNEPESHPKNLCFTYKAPRLPELYLKYKPGEPIGKGAFSKINKGLCRVTKKVVAVKKTWRGGDQSDNSLERELEIMKSVDHPFVIKLIDAEVTRLEYGFVLELAPGGSLFDYSNSENGLTKVKFCRIFYQVLSGLEYLHNMKIIHRDLKRENILIFDKAKQLVKIADFGASRTFDTQPLKSLVGTAAYASPELNILGLERSYDETVDMWSVGVAMYFSSFLKSPFPEAKFRSVTQDDISAIIYTRYGQPSLADSARNLIQELLVFEPKSRLTASIALKRPIFAEQQADLKDLVDILDQKVTSPPIEEEKEDDVVV